MKNIFIVLTFLLCSILAACGNRPSGEIQSPAISVDLKTTKMDTPTTDSIPMIAKEVLLGKIIPSTDEEFVLIPSQHTTKSGIYLRKETYEAFEQMASAAEQDHIHLNILSATRTFSDQKQIWEDKWTGRTLVNKKSLAQAYPDPVKRALAILTYSSMPGTSRHHWGTDMDLNSLEPAYFNTGEGKKIYEWLVSNASSYGFCQPYSEKGEARPDGYNEEKWHWSYMPISKTFLESYSAQIKNEDIQGFLGSETAIEVDVVEKYVKGVNAECK